MMEVYRGICGCRLLDREYPLYEDSRGIGGTTARGDIKAPDAEGMSFHNVVNYGSGNTDGMPRRRTRAGEGT